MATAVAGASSLNDETDHSATNTASNRQLTSIDNLKKRAFISNPLPEDFLRIMLDETQLAERKDLALAHSLQYNMIQNYMPYQAIHNNLVMPGQQFRSRIADMEAEASRGRLQIGIIEAKLNKNYGFTKMDPYVRIKLGNKIYETPTAYNGSKNPVWKKSVFCYLPKNVDMMIIEIYDEKSFTDDELIAFVKYPLPKHLYEGKFVEEWIPLSGKLGEQKEGYINVQLVLAPFNFHAPTPASTLPTQNSSSLNSSRASTESLNSHTPAAAASNQTSSLNQPSVVQIPPESPTRSLSSPGRSSIDADQVHLGLETYSESDLKAVHEMFPSFDLEIVRSILESKGGNKEAAIEALLQMVVD